MACLEINANGKIKMFCSAQNISKKLCSKAFSGLLHLLPFEAFDTFRCSYQLWKRVALAADQTPQTMRNSWSTTISQGRFVFSDLGVAKLLITTHLSLSSWWYAESYDHLPALPTTINNIRTYMGRSQRTGQKKLKKSR